MGERQISQVSVENGKEWSRGGAAFTLSAVLALLCSCASPTPTRDDSVLRAIKTESQRLMATHPIDPIKGPVQVDKGEWTPVIASLQPDSVTVYQWGVDISIKQYFDGGWGYEIPGNKRDLPMPEKCYSEPGQGVFWHGPC